MFTPIFTVHNCYTARANKLAEQLGKAFEAVLNDNPDINPRDLEYLAIHEITHQAGIKVLKERAAAYRALRRANKQI
jgi:hypothetical protein